MWVTSTHGSRSQPPVGRSPFFCVICGCCFFAAWGVGGWGGGGMIASLLQFCLTRTSFFAVFAVCVGWANLFCCSSSCPNHGVRRRSSGTCLHHLAAFSWRLALLLHTLGAGSFFSLSGCLSWTLFWTSRVNQCRLFEKRIHHAVPRKRAVSNIATCLTDDADFSRAYVLPAAEKPTKMWGANFWVNNIIRTLPPVGY